MDDKEFSRKAEELIRKLTGAEDPRAKNVKGLKHSPMEYALLLEDWAHAQPYPQHIQYETTAHLSPESRLVLLPFFERFGIVVPLDSEYVEDIKVVLDTWLCVLVYFSRDIVGSDKPDPLLRMRIERWGPFYLPYLQAIKSRNSTLLAQAAKDFGVERGIRPGHVAFEYIEEGGDGPLKWNIVNELRDKLKERAPRVTLVDTGEKIQENKSANKSSVKAKKNRPALKLVKR